MKIEVKGMKFNGKFVPASSKSKKPDVYNFDISCEVNDIIVDLSLSVNCDEIDSRIEDKLIEILKQ